MNKKDIMIIDEMVEQVSLLQYRQPVAESEEQAKEWLKDKIAYWTEQLRYLHPLPLELKPQIEEAASRWVAAEDAYLRHIGKRRDWVFQEFHRIHDLMNTKVSSLEIISSVPFDLQNISKFLLVRNIGWVHCFSWNLPYIDPENSNQFRDIGRVMVVAMYILVIAKREYEFPVDLLNHNHFRNIESEYLYAFDEA